MSLANFLNVQKTLTANEIELRNEPNELGDSARISDTICYKGNATYPRSTTQTIPQSAEFITLFETGIDADYLSVKPVQDIFNFTQLAHMEYSVFVKSHSTEKFEYRVAIFNEQEERIFAYETLTFDPSTNAQDPPVIDGFTINGWSVQLPPEAFYAFLEIRVLDAGSIEVQFNYANSTLQNAIDNSTQSITGLLGSRDSKNIFTSSYFVAVRDSGGVERDLTIIENEIAVLQNTTATQTQDITNLNTNKYDKTGGIISGNVAITGTTKCEDTLALIDGIQFGILPIIAEIKTETFGNTEGLSLQSAYVAISNIGGNTTFAVDSVDGVVSIENSLLKTPNYPDLDTQVKLNENNINANLSIIQQNTGSLSNKLSVDGGTMSGSINMSGLHRITNSALPIADGDLVNRKFYFDNLSGGGGGGGSTTKTHLFLNNSNHTINFPTGQHNISFPINFNIILPSGMDWERSIIEELRISVVWKDNVNIADLEIEFSNNGFFFFNANGEGGFPLTTTQAQQRIQYTESVSSFAVSTINAIVSTGASNPFGHPNFTYQEPYTTNASNEVGIRIPNLQGSFNNGTGSAINGQEAFVGIWAKITDTGSVLNSRENIFPSYFNSII